MSKKNDVHNLTFDRNDKIFNPSISMNRQAKRTLAKLTKKRK